jgi:hypothetical protein
LTAIGPDNGRTAEAQLTPKDNTSITKNLKSFFILVTLIHQKIQTCTEKKITNSILYNALKPFVERGVLSQSNELVDWFYCSSKFHRNFS